MTYLSRSARLARRLRPTLRSVIAGAALLGVAACSETTGTSGDPARVSVLLTDAPGDFHAAVVTISSIYLQGGSGGRMVLMDTPYTTDLLTLANTTAELVRDVPVPAGTYSELRFVITGGYVEVENADGSTSIFASSPDYEGLPDGVTPDGTLQMPSFGQSGLKVKFPGDARLTLSGEQRILLVDFDVSRSFGRLAGESGQWVMHPVLEATDLGATGSVRVQLELGEDVTLPQLGESDLTLADVSAVLVNADGGEEAMALTDVNSDGVFEATFDFVLPGDYTLEFRVPDESVVLTTAPATPIDVTVPSGGNATVAAVVTAAE